MKAYLVISGTIFGLMTALHIWRAVAERPPLATNPLFHLLTLLSAALCGWAVWLVKRSSRP